ncbi:hypothetical protein GCM10028817_22010 [Spirosoma pomorum]
MVAYACMRSEIYEQDIPEKQLNVLVNKSNEFSANYKSDNIILVFNAKTNNSVTESKLKIYDKMNRTESLIESNFSVDVSERGYKLIQQEKIIKESKNIIANKIALNTEDLVRIFETFGKSITNNETIDNSSQLIESLFFHNAILNTINRSKKEKTDCGCTPYEGYFVGKTYFWCQEDYLINPKKIISYIDEAGIKLDEQGKSLYNLLVANQGKEEISIDKVYLRDKSDFNNKVYKSYVSILNSKNARVKCEECATGLCGSSLGCCSNYEGCCWFSHTNCLAHDIMCLKCDHWYCGPLCKPEHPPVPH